MYVAPFNLPFIPLTFALIHRAPDYGGKNIAPSQAVLTTKVQTWQDFVKSEDWSKVLSG